MSQRSLRRTSGPLSQAGSRLGMSHKDVTERVPQLTNAAQKLRDGTLTREEYDALVSAYKPVEPYASAPMPTSREDALAALSEPKRAQYGATANIPAGERTELRLDIPAYTGSGAWVNSVHRPQTKQPTAYSSTSSANNVSMIVPEGKALDVAAGGAKSPFAVMRGEWNPMSDEEALARMKQALEEPSRWKQIGMDPERHGYFYDRTTMQPVTRAEEVVQVGPLVVGRDVTYGSKSDFRYADGGEVEADDAALQRMMRELQDENALMRDQEIADQPEDAGIVINPNTAPESVMAKIYASFGMDGYQRGGKVRPGGQLSRQEAKKVAESLERASTERDIRNVPLPSDINEVFDAMDYSIPGTKNAWSRAAQDTIRKNIEHGFFSAPDPVALSVASDPRNVSVFASNVLSGEPHSIDLSTPRPTLGTMLSHPAARHVDPYHAAGPHGFGMTMHTHPNSLAIPSGPDFDLSGWVGRDILQHANIHGIEGTHPDSSSRSLIFTRPDLAKSGPRFGLKQQINWDLVNDPDFFRRAQFTDPALENRNYQITLSQTLAPILTERLLDRIGRGKVWTQFDPNATFWNVDGKPLTLPGATDEILKSFDDVVRNRWGYAEGGAVSNDMLTYGMRPQAMSDGWRASSPAMEYSWPTPQQQADTAIASGLSSFTPGSAGTPGGAGQATVDTRSVSAPGMNAGRALGVVGQLGSMFTGIPGLGLAGTALGTALDAREYDAALDAARAANPGYAFPGLTASQVMSGIANNLSFGTLGTPIDYSFVDNAIAGTAPSRGGASGPGTGDPEADAAAAAAAAAAGLGNAAEAAVDAGQIS